MASETDRTLELRFHGRVIEHLGIQMYQSPVAAIAEIVANAWDADAEKVEITLPDELGDGATIVVEDDGIGMTFEDCQEKYLSVGWSRRGDSPDERSSDKDRAILGRKGIGKFAGFGIAKIIHVETISKETGEKTVFQMDMEELRGEQYVHGEPKEIPVIEDLGPDATRRERHGTKVILKNLSLSRRLSVEQFVKSMARRFLLHERVADFRVEVNGEALQTAEEVERVQFVFPQDYSEDDLPAEVTVNEQGWAEEEIAEGQTIRWRIAFYEQPVADEDLRGIAVFCRGKLAQAPFFFALERTPSAQYGQEYMAGRVEADYLDESETDLIATERQRLNWEHSATEGLREWGRARIRELLRIWRGKRRQERRRRLEQRLAGFSNRLDRLQAHEKRSVRRALENFAELEQLSDEQFDDIGNALLTAWEQGRLRELIEEIAQADLLSSDELLSILVEAQVLTALNVAEAVKTKLRTVAGLKDRIERQELERAVRDYIAENPWLISPRWETFRVESSVNELMRDAAERADMRGSDWEGRVDLALASGSQLLILEFMRPGLTVDWDHVSRYERYVLTIRENLAASTAARFDAVVGYLVADGIDADAALTRRIRDLAARNMFALDWRALLSEALSDCREYLEALLGRAPDDERLRALAEQSVETNPSAHGNDA